MVNGESNGHVTEIQDGSLAKSSSSSSSLLFAFSSQLIK